MKTKVLIFHLSVGYGIRVTAENIRNELEKSGKFETKIYDVQKVEDGWLATGIEKTYLFILDKLSFLWGFLYHSNFVLNLVMPLRKIIASFNSKNVLQILREFQPAVVVSTQTVGTGIVAYLKSKGMYRGKLVAVFSDYHLQKFWLYDEVDLYVCAIEEQAAELRSLGVADEKIVISGIFVSEKYNKQIDREEACREMGLLTSMPTVLLTGGAQTRLAMKDVFLRLLRSPLTFQVAVVAGKNELVKEELEKISAPKHHPVKIYGFINNMDVLMSASSVLVGKTGGPTMAEAVVKKLPLVLTDVRPGHEQANLDFLLRHGIADYARIPREAVFMVEQILQGKMRRDWDRAYKTIIKHPNSVNIVEALSRILHDQTMTVRNYQDN